MSKQVIVAALLVGFVVTPISAGAATYTTNAAVYNGMSVQEKIAYLYGMIAQLQWLLQQKLDLEGSGSSSSNNADVDVDTLSATNINKYDAELRMQIDLNGEDEAVTWFEYGQSSSRLNERTSKTRVTDSRGDVRTISDDIDNLDSGEKYYFRAVVEDENGDRSYGSTRSFTTDGSSSGSSSSGDFALDVDDTSISAGDDIEVTWQVEDGEEGSQNWIGLYKTGANNNTYVKWVYVDNDTDGTEYFTIDTAGTYEFRLFLDNNYTDVATSPRVTVD